MKYEFWAGESAGSGYLDGYSSGFGSMDVNGDGLSHGV